MLAQIGQLSLISFVFISMNFRFALMHSSMGDDCLTCLKAYLRVALCGKVRLIVVRRIIKSMRSDDYLGLVVIGVE